MGSSLSRPLFNTLHPRLPHALAAHLNIAADLFTGYRPLRYITGMPESPSFAALGWIVELLLVIAATKLARSKNPIDRFLKRAIFYLLTAHHS